MKTVYFSISLGLILFAVEGVADTGENTKRRCQQLARDFSENPDSLKVDRLKELQFCINQTLAQRNATVPPTMLKGTIIDPPPSSETETPSVPQQSDIQSQ